MGKALFVCLWVVALVAGCGPAPSVNDGNLPEKCEVKRVEVGQGITEKWECYPGGRWKTAGQERIDFTRVGTWKMWHENGQLELACQYDAKGHPCGTCRKWDAEGNPTETTSFPACPLS